MLHLQALLSLSCDASYICTNTANINVNANNGANNANNANNMSCVVNVASVATGATVKAIVNISNAYTSFCMGRDTGAGDSGVLGSSLNY